MEDVHIEGEAMREGGGCLTSVLALLILAAIGAGIQQCSSMFEGDPLDGPIPKRFAGAYNSMGCEHSSSKIASLVTVGGDSIRYDSASFTVDEVVSGNDSSITFRGRPSGIGWSEGSRTFTMTYAPVRGTAMLDGSEYERCSQY